ncbi:hypothetical protein ABZ345_20165 [Lentzea sp. NPDC005914]|uniref:LppU/SCO3897 family protein n=1 Tax=Lentzea sp. NPDC005914 TaxID=3154572 RepID=UPI003403BED8
MRKPVLVIALAAFVVAAAAGFVFVKFAGGPRAKAGECVALANRSDNRADVSSAGCATGDVRFKVGKVLADAAAGCPAGDDEYVQVVPNSGGGKLCLLPNLAEGACYRPADDEDSWVKAECAGEETVKVTKVISSAGDAVECPDGENSASIVYAEPPTTYCLAFVQRSTGETAGT